MTTNFLAILRNKQDTECRRIRVSKGVQDDLAAEFERQADAFLVHTHRVRHDDGTSEMTSEESARISFFPIYTLHDNSEVFEIENYALDPAVLAAAKSPDTVDDLKLDDATTPSLRAICAATTTRNSTRILFQAFEQRRLLSKNRWTFLEGANVFSRLDKAGFTLGDHIQAIYEDKILLFRSFPVVSRFINLLDQFNEASNDKIEDVLAHKVLHVADVQDVIDHADTFMRKQFAAVSELKVLDKVKPNAAKQTAAEFDIDLKIHREDGKTQIEFPKAKKDQKEILTFLTEGYYKGPLTGTPYLSNSHRPKNYKKKPK